MALARGAGDKGGGGEEELTIVMFFCLQLIPGFVHYL